MCHLRSSHSSPRAVWFTVIAIPVQSWRWIASAHMVAAVHSCIVWVYGDRVIRQPTVIRRSRSEVQYLPDDCSTHTNNLRGSNMDGTIEPPQIRLSSNALVVVSLLFILRKLTEFSADYLPQTSWQRDIELDFISLCYCRCFCRCWCTKSGPVQELLLMRAFNVHWEITNDVHKQTWLTWPDVADSKFRSRAHCAPVGNVFKNSPINAQHPWQWRLQCSRVHFVPATGRWRCSVTSCKAVILSTLSRAFKGGWNFSGCWD